MTPEQIKELQEKVKNMSPEELKEFQKQQCIFCHIVSGKVQSKKIYEDDKVIGILDINPSNPGHILLLPKEHFQIMPLVPEDIISHLFIATKKLSQACLKALKCQGTTIFVANGMVAGQKAQHFMVHIIPRMEDDELSPLNLSEGKVTKKKQKELYNKLKPRVNHLFSVDTKEQFDEPEGETEEEKPRQARSKSKKQVVEAEFEEEEKDEESDEEDSRGVGSDDGEDSDEEESDGVDLDSITDLLGGGA
jgi:histidine triad (HIT) family protein